MALVVPNAGEGRILGNLTNKTAPEDLRLKLYTNDITPSESDVAATYTEASGNGYPVNGLSLLGSSWNPPVEADPSYIDYPKQTFTFTGALGNVYGYYIVEATSGIIKWSERFTGAPYNIVNNGDKIEITPRIEAS